MEESTSCRVLVGPLAHELERDMEILLILMAIAAGSSAPMQAGINSQLSVLTESPILAALISFAVGTLSLACYSLAVRISWPAVQTFAALPWWMWTGGLLGAVLVAVTIFLAPKLGAATLMASMVTGQMTASIILDHYGLIGYPLRSASIWRLVGVAFLITGVLIIRKY